MRMLGHQLKPDQLQECIEEVDGDGPGFVDFDEFLVLMTKKTKEAEEEKEVREAFRILDKEGKGTIDAQVLKEILLALDETMTEADVDEMVDEIDEDGSGAVDYEEFKALLSPIMSIFRDSGILSLSIHIPSLRWNSLS